MAMIDQPVGAVGLQGTLGALVHFLPTTEARGATATMVIKAFLNQFRLLRHDQSPRCGQGPSGTILRLYQLLNIHSSSWDNNIFVE
jgi:hypothetical protein